MKSPAAFLIANALALAACGGKNDPNEKNFSAAVTHYLDKKQPLCLDLGPWPVDLMQHEQLMTPLFPSSKGAKMAALTKLGLVTVTNAEKVERGRVGGARSTYSVKRFTLTEGGKKFYRTREVDEFRIDGAMKVQQGDLCYGKEALANIVKWEGPVKFGDYQEARVVYHYQIDDLAPWTRAPEFSEAFPNEARTINSAGKQAHEAGVKLTSVGWEPKGNGW